MSLSVSDNTELIEDLSRRTAAPVELVKNLYEHEVTNLRADATSVKLSQQAAAWTIDATVDRAALTSPATVRA